MTRTIYRTALALGALFFMSAAVHADPPKPTPDQTQPGPDQPKLTADETAILSAIDRVLANPTKPDNAKDIAKIVTFAQNSPTITIMLRADFCPRTGGDRDRLCFCCYVAGATQFRLLHPEASKDMYADVVPGIRAALVGYRSLKKAEPAYANPHWEQMDSLDHSGQLETWVASIKNAPKPQAPKPASPVVPDI